MEQRILPKESGTNFSDKEIEELKLREGDASPSDVLRILARLEAAELTVRHFSHYLPLPELKDCATYLGWRKAAGK